MIQFAIHPQVYATGAGRGLLGLLEQTWVRSHTAGEGCIYIISGFGNYNGGVRFYNVLRKHCQQGGKIVSYFGGSTSQRLTSKQVAEELLDCGAEVNIVNRKRILHAKCYGWESTRGNSLIVSSGNFTGPGMSQNIEASVLLEPQATASAAFSWNQLVSSFRSQRWDVFPLSLTNRTAPGWRLLYDEQAAGVRIDESEESTMILTLSTADTQRIQAPASSSLALGTPYFWLSKDCYDFFPPLTITNARGLKATYRCIITLNYVDLGQVAQSTVTFEAQNNLDFRFRVSLLKGTRRAAPGDMAAISRVGDSEYELRLFAKGSPEFSTLIPYAINFIGHRGKKYGYIPNEEFFPIIGVTPTTRTLRRGDLAIG